MVFHSVTEAAVLIFPTVYALTGGLILPRHSMDEALVRIAGATTIVNAANGLSVNDAIAVAKLSSAGASAEAETA